MGFDLSLGWTDDWLPEWRGQEHRDGVIVLRKFTPAEAVQQAVAQDDAMTSIMLTTARGIMEVTGDEQTPEARRYLNQIVRHLEQGAGATSEDLERLCRTAEHHLDNPIPRRRVAMLAEAVVAARDVMNSASETQSPSRVD